jgi:hypothetical protein
MVTGYTTIRHTDCIVSLIVNYLGALGQPQGQADSPLCRNNGLCCNPSHLVEVDQSSYTGLLHDNSQEEMRTEASSRITRSH